MLQLQPVPFSCPYHADVRCPLSVMLAERAPDTQSVVEALPCQVCSHYVERAQTIFSQRRVQLGPLGRHLLELTRTSGRDVFPLSWALRTQFPQRVDLRRVRKAVLALAALHALRAFRLPAVVPRTENSHHLVLRETLWVQLTAVGALLSAYPFGQHGAKWRHQHRQFAAQLHTLRTELAHTDLFAVYVQQIVTIMTQVTQHLVAATDHVMVARCTSMDSPYVSVFAHLEAIAPAACEALQQCYLRAQDARRRAVALYHTAERRHVLGHNAPPERVRSASGVEL